ncbi:tetratricopeptide repeat protein 1 [Eupeodes corollae]|uniref:tetratricopeptide repeat protein 1 n=1 Tax=Eupeodes corollae TaxID=290404 RepID=UPI002492A515|nr:tetratricopeptide repeat protein 1 [Eupeodes corollae]
MSNCEDNAVSDDEFQDAESKTNADIIDEIVSKQSELSLQDNEDNKDSGHLDVIDNENKKSATDIFSDCHDDLIDEEHLRELEKDLTDEQKLKNKEEADTLKQKSNELFKSEQYTESVEMYTNALKLCPLEYTKERSVLYANRAAAKIKLDSKNAAIDDCTKALELNPDYVRALLRRAKLFEDTGKLDEALEDYNKVLELDKGNLEANEAVVRLPPLIHERNEKLKAEMLGKLKDLGNMILKPFGLSTNNFEMKQDPSGSYSFNFNQNK